MTQKELIRQEIEIRRQHMVEDLMGHEENCEYHRIKGMHDAYVDLLTYLDYSLPEEKPSEDLEEAAEEWCKENGRGFVLRDKAAYYIGETLPAFIAGAEWMRKKDVEDMYMSDNRHFLKCYEQGKVDQKVEMMKDAVEGEVTVGRLPDDWSLAYNPDELHRALLKFKSGDKVKIIIVKKKEEET